MSHYIKIYPFSIPQGLMLVFNLNLFSPLKPSSISCCVSVPSAEMSTAPPNHRRGKPGGTAYLHFGLSLTTIQTLDSQNLQHLSFFFSPPNDLTAIKPGVNTAGVTGPTSQIPGLSQSAETDTPVERISGRRVGIFESDSEYVKLAKGGGRRGEAASVN